MQQGRREEWARWRDRVDDRIDGCPSADVTELLATGIAALDRVLDAVIEPLIDAAIEMRAWSHDAWRRSQDTDRG